MLELMAAMADPTRPTVPETKACFTCRAVRPLADFGRDRNAPDGRKGRCKPCLAADMAVRRYNSPAAVAKREKARRQAELGLKDCNKCGLEKPVAEFFVSSDRPDGRSSQCATCKCEYNRKLYEANKEHRRARLRETSKAWRAQSEARLEYERQWREQNKERINENARKRFQKDPVKATLSSHKRRAQKLGTMAESIDTDQIWADQGGLCALCGNRIDPDLRWPHSQSRSLDHIVPLSLGGTHTADNLQWVHLRGNLRKHNKLVTEEWRPECA